MNWLKTTFKMVLITEWLGWLSTWITTRGKNSYFIYFLRMWGLPQVRECCSTEYCRRKFLWQECSITGIVPIFCNCKKVARCLQSTPSQTHKAHTHAYKGKHALKLSKKVAHCHTHTQKNAHKRIKSLQTHTRTRTQTQTCKKKVLQIVMFAKIHTHA